MNLYGIKRKLSVRTVKKLSASLLVHILLIAIVFLVLFPFFSGISGTFMSTADLRDKTVTFIPGEPSLEVLNYAMAGLSYWQVLFNTAGLSLLVAILQTVSCCMISYGFARFAFKGRGALFAIVLLTLIIPPQIIMSPIFMRFRFFDLFGVFSLLTGNTLNLIDTPWPFALLSATGLGFKNGLYIYLLRQFFRGLPKELEEAAKVDGAGFIKTFFLVMLPNSFAMLLTIFLFSFSWQWTDNYYTAIFLKDFLVVSKSLSLLTQYMVAFLDPVFRNAMVSTGVLLTIAPLFLLFLLLQKFFIQGVAKSGIVG